MKRPTMLLLVLVTLPLGSLFAADGATPIWEPTTITEPGRYFLVRDISAETSPIIEITANHVDLDLKGHTLTLTGGQWQMIQSVGYEDVSIRNGHLVGGRVYMNGSRIRVSGLTMTNTYLYFEARHGVIENTLFGGGQGINVDDGTNVRVARNQVDGSTIELESCSGCQILENTVSNSPGIGINVRGLRNSRVVGNVVTGCANGISSEHGNWQNHFESNVASENNGYGFRFSGDSRDNVYRGNTARNNNGTGCTGVASGGDFCDEGTNNTSHGDNYMPAQM